MWKKKLMSLMGIFGIVLMLSSCTSQSHVGFPGSNNTTGGGDGCGCNDCCCNNNSTCNSTITILDNQANPVQDATVTIYGITSQTHITDANGEVVATQLIDGQYVMKVVVNGYENDVTTFNVTNNVCPVVDITLDPLPTCSGVFSIYSVSGVSHASSTPLTTAEMNINGQQYTANSSGIIIAPGLFNGTYPYTLTASGYNTVTGTYIVANNTCPDQSINMTPPCAYSISGVLHGSIPPVVGADMTINGQSYLADSNGIITMPDLPDGTYSYTITATGYDSDTGTYVVADNICQSQSITINSTPCSVVFQIMSGGLPVPNQTISLSLDIGDSNGGTVSKTTDSNGDVTISKSDIIIQPGGTHSYSVSYTDINGNSYSGFGSFSFLPSANCVIPAIVIIMSETAPLAPSACNVMCKPGDTLDTTPSDANEGMCAQMSVCAGGAKCIPQVIGYYAPAFSGCQSCSDCQNACSALFSDCGGANSCALTCAKASGYECIAQSCVAAEAAVPTGK